MKNPSKSVSKDKTAEMQAKKAIQRIQKWVETNYPLAASKRKTRLIIECLIEVVEERKYLAAQ